MSSLSLIGNALWNDHSLHSPYSLVFSIHEIGRGRGMVSSDISLILPDPSFLPSSISFYSTLLFLLLSSVHSVHFTQWEGGHRKSPPSSLLCLFRFSFVASLLFLFAYFLRSQSSLSPSPTPSLSLSLPQLSSVVLFFSYRVNILCVSTDSPHI